MKKFSLLFFLIAVFTVAYSVTFYNPMGPALFPVAEIFNGNDDQIECNYWKTLDEAQVIMLKKNADFIVLPVAYGFELINKGLDYKYLGTSLWKTFFLVSDLDIKDYNDLKDKKVITIHGPGQTADLVLKMLNIKYNLNMEIGYVSSGADIISLLATGKEHIAVLPEPYVSLSEVKTKNKYTVKLDLQEVYSQITGLDPKIPITGLFVKNGTDSDTVRKIENMYADSANHYFYDNKDAVVSFVYSVMEGKMPEAVLKKAAARSLIRYSTDRYAVTDYLEILKEFGEIGNFSEDMFY